MQAMKIHSGKIAKIINPISVKEFEVLVIKLPTKATNGTDDFTGKFYQTFQEEIMQSPNKLFQKTKQKERREKK